MKKNKVSIIIPVYKVEPYIDECLNSIVNQTYSNLEIILVDDGSPDTCPQKCDEWASKDSRIRVVHKQNGGLSSARNAGMDVATGDFFMFVDSDDFIESNMVESLLDIHKKQESDITCCEVNRVIDGIKKPIDKFHRSSSVYSFTSIEVLKAMIHRNIDCASWNKLYTRKIIAKNRFPIGRNNEDFVFLYYVYKNVTKVTYTNVALYDYRMRGNSITTTFNKKTLDQFLNIEDIEKDANLDNVNIFDELLWYKFNTYVSVAYEYYKNHRNPELKDDFKLIKSYVRSNIKQILVGGDLNTKVKIKALLIVLNIV